MKKRLFSLLLISLLLTSASSSLSAKSKTGTLTYFFNTPAQIWEETLPLGNGRIGIMPDGGLLDEKIVLNEISLWSGSNHDAINPKAGESLPKIQELLLAGENVKAQELMYQTFVCKGQGSQGSAYGSYQIFGNLEINYGDQIDSGRIENYRRELDIANAVSKTTYKINNTSYTREYFTSFSDDVAVIRLQAKGKDKLNLSIALNRVERARNESEEGDLTIYGFMDSGQVGMRGMEFASRMKVILPSKGEKFLNGKSLQINDANEVIILLAMRTDYWGDNPQERVNEDLEKAERKVYSKLLSQHKEVFKEKFGRVSLDLGINKEQEEQAIPERLANYYENGDDPSLVSLYFQFGRYLLISSTREGLLPPNLQGLWANTVRGTPWNGDYHLNINLQMNLWPAESTNLSELHLPTIEWTKSQVPSGEKTAQAFYNSSGWVTHILGNVWEFTAPGEHPSWGATNTAAAWLCQHLYSHYEYSLDKEYLADVYPTMKGAAEFFVDMLIENPKSGYLITAPTTSPENAYIMDNGDVASVAAGSTMDNQIVRELFSNVIKASELLKIDDSFRKILEEKRSRLMPTTISKDGRIMEWLEEYGEAEPKHRHVSHLYGLYPGSEISVSETPELAEAARESLEARGDGGTGWSMAWKVNFWARLQDGNKALSMLNNLMKPTLAKVFDYSDSAGTYPNLFCAHPPFQIDGNFGGCAGIAEMLMQSKTGAIEILPALPDAWANGEVKGLKAQGNNIVDIAWNKGELTKFTIHSNTGEPVKLITNRAVKNNSNVISSVEHESGYFITEIKTKKNKKTNFKVN